MKWSQPYFHARNTIKRCDVPIVALLLLPDTLEKLERGEMIKDYNANTRVGDGGGAESEDEDDPKSPTSISSQSSSQGYDSAGSDFVDIEGFANIPDSSLPELQLQVISTHMNLTTF